MISIRTIKLQKVETGEKGKSKYIVGNQNMVVEEAAMHHYQALGFKTIWSENDYWWTLMALLFWDVIFAKVEGAVTIIRNGFQIYLDPSDRDFDRYYKQHIELNGMPSDFFSNEFYHRRENIVKNRIQELKNTDLQEQLTRSYKKNYGKQCRPINDWDKFHLEELSIGPSHLGPDKTILIMDRLLRNFNDNRAGLPDLIVFRENDMFFSEVKGEKDKISDQQRDWHDFIARRVGAKVELFLVNPTERQIENIKYSYYGKSKSITVSFGYSSSKKRDEAIQFAKSQSTYFIEGVGKDAIHGATFDVKDVEAIFEMLDLTSGWKTQKIIVDDVQFKSSDVREALWCFRKKNQENASSDWCKKLDYENKNSKFGCSHFEFSELEHDRWQEYGYIDTTSGEWVFDLSAIEERIEERIKRLSLCPLFNAEKVRKVFKKLPNRIDPKQDPKWALRANDYSMWFWHEGKWMNSYGETRFPGMAMMVGIEKIGKKERNEAVRFASDDYFSTPKRITVKSEDKKSGCFIATAVYGDVNHPKVRILRIFRDSRLGKHVVGRALVALYYSISPSLAFWINKHEKSRKILRSLLDWIVKIIE